MAAVPDPVAGDSPNTKVACVQNKTKKALKELLKASSAGVVQGITVTLAFTMDGLTYTCALPVAKEKPSANEGFPELFNLMERETNAPRSAAFLSLVTGTVAKVTSKKIEEAKKATAKDRALAKKAAEKEERMQELRDKILEHQRELDLLDAAENSAETA